MSTRIANKEGLSLKEGLQLAKLQLKTHQEEIARELAELAAAGVSVSVSAEELFTLELVGLLYDFETGFVEKEGRV